MTAQGRLVDLHSMNIYLNEGKQFRHLRKWFALVTGWALALVWHFEGTMAFWRTPSQSRFPRASHTGSISVWLSVPWSECIARYTIFLQLGSKLSWLLLSHFHQGISNPFQHWPQTGCDVQVLGNSSLWHLLPKGIYKGNWCCSFILTLKLNLTSSEMRFIASQLRYGL